MSGCQDRTCEGESSRRLSVPCLRVGVVGGRRSRRKRKEESQNFSLRKIRSFKRKRVFFFFSFFFGPQHEPNFSAPTRAKSKQANGRHRCFSITPSRYIADRRPEASFNRVNGWATSKQSHSTKGRTTFERSKNSSICCARVSFLFLPLHVALRSNLMAGLCSEHFGCGGAMLELLERLFQALPLHDQRFAHQ